MAGDFPFSSVPWYTTNAAKFVGNVGLGSSARVSLPNYSLRCNCKAGFEALTDRSMCTASRYWESADYSGVEVRRSCDPSSSAAAVYQLAGDLGKCSNNCATGTPLGSAFNASDSTGPCISCEVQRPVLLDANITATSGQNPPNLAVHSLNSGRTRPKYFSEYKTRNPTQKSCLEFKPGSIDDAYYPNMLSNSSEELEAGKNTEPLVEKYSNDLASFSDSVDENRLQKGYARGRGKHDINKIQENGNVLKRRKAGETERKAVAADVQSWKNVDEESRIVRISRQTGGKDRHSKVLTAKGIRDRRVRLSVPTAIQFYDLLERLGFEQPSKTVDWLIYNARSAIDELPVLDVEMAAASATASAGNVTRLISSHVKHCVASSRESATAAAASAFRFGLGSLEGEGTSSHKAINEKAISVMTDSDLRRSSGSTSDGSIKGSVEHYTSNSSMLKPYSRVQARLNARERARKKSASAKNFAGSPSAIRQLKSMQPSLTTQFKGVLPFTRVPVESQCIKDDYPSGIYSQILSGTDSVQPLWDYNTPSYTGILFTTKNSHPLQNTATLGSSAIQNCFLPVPGTADSTQAVIVSSSLQSFEMADSVIPFSDQKQSRHMGGNAEQSRANLFNSNIPMHIIRSVDQQKQQQSEMHIYKNFASTIIPTFSNDINFSTSSLSSRGPLQSNSSASITNMTCLPDSEECLW